MFTKAKYVDYGNTASVRTMFQNNNFTRLNQGGVCTVKFYSTVSVIIVPISFYGLINNKLH